MNLNKFLKLSTIDKHLYTVEIPNDTGANYLQWDEEISVEFARTIEGKLAEIGFPDVLVSGSNGQALYAELEDLFGSDQEASDFLNSLGIIGVSYPAEFRSGERVGV